jgi:16S rRNA (guanine527-N7)-methyltransferase
VVLQRYAQLLEDTAIPMGFLASSDRGRLWDRHIMDSLRGLACLPAGPAQVLDAGSGAGLPGVPIAIARPDCQVRLVEPRSRRAAFLELVVERLAIQNIRVTLERVEATSEAADVALARALAGPAASWDLVERSLRSGGSLIYWAGRSWDREGPADLARLPVEWRICSPASFPWQGPLVMMGRRHVPASG